MSRVAVASHPFGEGDDAPLRLLREAGADLALNPRRRKLKPDELVELLAGAGAVVAGTEVYDAAVLARAPDLRLIARTGVGLDNVDLEACRARGVAVTWTPEAPSDSAAELAVGLLLALARHIPAADRLLRQGAWDRKVGALLRDRTVGVVGLGRIGARVARLLHPFGCRLLATDIDPAVAPRAADLGVTLVPLDELLSTSDAVTLHVPLTPATRGLIDARALELLRPGALLVNTARGEVVDEAALLAALEAGRLGGAALDVFADEPYQGPLTGRDDVVLTCHMGSCTREGRLAMELGAARSVAAWLRGEATGERVV
ncbi:MAG: phosphoglycerate dehydrogenase [Planctomycetota bacterium]|nr:phosphoglycerate dehydrogenase [Planctomycetota bacterium]